METLGVFPLNLVLLPGERVPLHIFEERYKELIGECVDSVRPFVLVFADDDGEVHSVGTEANVIEVLNRYPDGRMDIIVEGGTRLTLEGLNSGQRSFLTAEVSPLVEEEDEASESEIAYCIEALTNLAGLAGQDIDLSDVEWNSFSIAGHVAFPPEVKQDLLETTSERERIEKLRALLDEAAKTVERKNAIASVASRNGHVPAS